MKNVVKKHNTTTNKKKHVLNSLKIVKEKIDRMEFFRIYMMNKNGEYIKRAFGGNHCPKSGSNRRNAKRKHYHHL